MYAQDLWAGLLGILVQGRNGEKLAMPDDSTVVIRVPPSIRTPLLRGAALVNKPMNAQAFCHHGRHALHGRLWGHTDLGSRSRSSTSCTQDLGNRSFKSWIIHL